MKKVILLLAVLVMFSIPPSAFAGTSSVTLAWDAPTTNADGTPLTDLAGYKLYYGPSSGNYTQNIDVGAVITYKAANLPDGLYFFVVTAYDTMGNESDYSNEVSTILDTAKPGKPGGCKIIKIRRN